LIVNVPTVLALVVTAVASVLVFLLMRYPQLRRPQFQGRRAFSVGVSLACALGVFAVFAFLIWRLQS
jgi:multisubunit Na+/H+ antiporter MnhB subunit